MFQGALVIFLEGGILVGVHSPNMTTSMFGIRIRVPLSHNPFHKGIPNHQIAIRRWTINYNLRKWTVKSSLFAFCRCFMGNAAGVFCVCVSQGLSTRDIASLQFTAPWHVLNAVQKLPKLHPSLVNEGNSHHQEVVSTIWHEWKPVTNGKCSISTGGGNSNVFFKFLPRTWGNDPIWRAYFSNGWFNHQLDSQ